MHADQRHQVDARDALQHDEEAANSAWPPRSGQLMPPPSPPSSPPSSPAQVLPQGRVPRTSPLACPVPSPLTPSALKVNVASSPLPMPRVPERNAAQSKEDDDEEGDDDDDDGDEGGQAAANGQAAAMPSAGGAPCQVCKRSGSGPLPKENGAGVRTAGDVAVATDRMAKAAKRKEREQERLQQERKKQDEVCAPRRSRGSSRIAGPPTSPPRARLNLSLFTEHACASARARAPLGSSTVSRR